MAKSLSIANAASSSHSKGNTNGYYVEYVSRDLEKLVEHVVPEGRMGLPNLMSTKQVRFISRCYLCISLIHVGTQRLAS